MDLGIDSIHDLNIKYKNGCIVTIKSEEHNIDVPTLFSIDHFTDEGTLVGSLDVGGKWSSYSIPIAEVEVDFSFPTLGAINYKGAVHLVKRHAPRQWRRAFTIANRVVTYESVDKITHSVMKSPKLGNNPPSLKAIFFPEYESIAKAIKLIEQKVWWSVALNNRYYIGVNMQLPYIYLGYNGYVIGRIRRRDASCIIFPTATPLIEDLSILLEIR